MSASAIDSASSVIQSFLQFALTNGTGQSQMVGASNTAPLPTDSVSFSAQALQLQTGATQGVSGTAGDNYGSGTGTTANPTGTSSVDTTSSLGVARPHHHHHHHHGGSGQSNSG